MSSVNEYEFRLKNIFVGGQLMSEDRWDAANILSPNWTTRSRGRLAGQIRQDLEGVRTSVTPPGPQGQAPTSGTSPEKDSKTPTLKRGFKFLTRKCK